jgi:hypothetical protein
MRWLTVQAAGFALLFQLFSGGFGDTDCHRRGVEPAGTSTELHTFLAQATLAAGRALRHSLSAGTPDKAPQHTRKIRLYLAHAASDPLPAGRLELHASGGVFGLDAQLAPAAERGQSLRNRDPPPA